MAQKIDIQRYLGWITAGITIVGAVVAIGKFVQRTNDYERRIEALEATQQESVQFRQEMVEWSGGVNMYIELDMQE